MVVSIVGWLVVVLVPGSLIYVILTDRRRPWYEVAVIVPTLGLGFVFLLGELARVVGMRFGRPLWLVGVVALGGLAIARVVRGRSRVSGHPERLPRVGLLLMAGGILFGGLIWLFGIDSLVVPPGIDAANHGAWTARILDEGSTVQEAIVVPSFHESGASGFYPLALHASVALALVDSGSVAILWTLVAALLAVIGLPVATFALARRLAPDQELVPGLAAAISPLLYVFAYGAFVRGQIPMLVGMVLAFGGIIVVADAVRSSSARSAILASAVLYGLLVTHSTQIVVAVGLGALLAVEQARETGWRVVRPMLLRLVVVGAGLLILVVPTALNLVGGLADRAVVPGNEPDMTLGASIATLLILHDKQSLSKSQMAPQALLVILSVVGVWILVRRRMLLGWIAAAGGIAVLYLVAASTTDGFARLLVLPWHSSSERLAANLIYFVPVFAGITVSAMLNWVDARGLRLLGTVAILGVVAASWFGLTDAFRTDAEYRTAVRREQLGAFEFLREHGGGTPIFANPEIDGAIWMYPTEALRPLVISDLDVDGGKLLRSAAMGDPEALHQLVSLNGVRYAFVSDTGFPTGFRWVTTDDLAANPSFVEVWSEGTAHVYRVSGP